jgi:hypothetical protein
MSFDPCKILISQKAITANIVIFSLSTTAVIKVDTPGLQIINFLLLSMAMDSGKNEDRRVTASVFI